MHVRLEEREGEGEGVRLEGVLGEGGCVLGWGGCIYM